MKNRIVFCLILMFSGISISAQTITFASSSFKTRLLLSNATNGVARDVNGNSIKIDSNNDGNIQVSEAHAVYQIKLEGGSIINNPGGIENFVNLTHLTLSDIYLKSLNVSTMPNLKELDCHNNIMTVLTLGNHPQLEKLDCGFNELVTLNTNGLPSLNRFDCNDNKLTSLNVTQSTGLITLYCHFNELTSLTVSGLQHLKTLDCSYNKLQNVSFAGLSDLDLLMLMENLFQSINLQDCGQLNTLYLDFNPDLTSLYVKNSGDEENFSFYQTPNLQYICCDAGEVVQYQSRVQFAGYVNCAVDAACALSTQPVTLVQSKVYPNPVTGVLSISGVAAEAVTIYDTAGKTLINKKLETTESAIDLSGLESGHYIVRLITKNGTIHHKIVKE